MSGGIGGHRNTAEVLYGIHDYWIDPAAGKWAGSGDSTDLKMGTPESWGHRQSYIDGHLRISQE